MKEFYVHPNCIALKNTPIDLSKFNEYDYACLLINDARGCSIPIDFEYKLPQSVATADNFINFVSGSKLLEQQKELFNYDSTAMANIEIGSFLEDFCQDSSYADFLIAGLEKDNIDVIKMLVEIRANYLTNKINSK